MRKDLILDNGSVIKHKHRLNGHGRNFSQEESAEGIRDGCIHAHQVEFHFEIVEGLQVNAESVPEGVVVPCCVLVGAVAGIVCVANLKTGWRV